MERGRPSAYTEGIAQEIIERLCNGETLRHICRDDHMPDERTVRRWAANLEHPFSPQYARARELGYQCMADELLDIADDGQNDWMERLGDEGKSEGWQLNGEHVQRSRIRIDTRKWLLAKALPKVYGDKVTSEITGKDGGPIETKDANVSARDVIRSRIADLAARGGTGSDPQQPDGAAE